jgi:circadian clock protein KaiC
MTDHRGGVERVSTGAPGLDALLEGGLLKGGVYVIQGTPGAGKTILGNQACYHQAAQGGRVVYVTLLAESHARMLAHLRRMSFFDAAAIPERVYYVSGFKVLESEGLEGLLRTLREAITSRKATLLVLDGLISAEEAASSDKAFKKFIHELQTVTGMTGCTVLLLSSTLRVMGLHPEHTMVDGIIELSDELTRLKSIRHIQILKMRGADQVRGQHSLEITNDGVVVRPRFETLWNTSRDEAAFAPGTERRGFGIASLDGLMDGGLPSNSISMLLGPSGAGKTILGLQFVAEGARRGEPSLYFGFFERPPALLLKSERIHLGLKEVVDSGLLELMWERPVEGVIDVLGERLLTAIRRRKVKRLCLDGMQGFQLAMDFPERSQDVFSALAEELEAAGVTTVYTAETNDLLGPRIEVPITGMSALTHNILLLRHVELRSQLHRLISIVKLRDSHYDSSIREFRITEEGIEVADTFQSAEQVLSGQASLTTAPRAKRAPPRKRPRRK